METSWWTVETIVESGGNWRLVEFGGDCRVQRILEAIVETQRLVETAESGEDWWRLQRLVETGGD